MKFLEKNMTWIVIAIGVIILYNLHTTTREEEESAYREGAWGGMAFRPKEGGNCRRKIKADWGSYDCKGKYKLIGKDLVCIPCEQHNLGGAA